MRILSFSFLFISHCVTGCLNMCLYDICVCAEVPICRSLLLISRSLLPECVCTTHTHTHKHTHTHTRGEGRQSLESVFAKTEGSRHTPYGAGYGSLHWSTARLLAASRGGLRHSSLTRLPTLLEASPGFGRLQQDRLHVYLVLPLACPPLIED